MLCSPYTWRAQKLSVFKGTNQSGSVLLNAAGLCDFQVYGEQSFAVWTLARGFARGGAWARNEYSLTETVVYSTPEN